MHTLVATFIAGSALVAVSACSNREDTTSPAAQASSSDTTSATVGTPEAPSVSSTRQSTDREVVAHLKGDDGIDGKIHSVRRQDGIVMVKFEVTNHRSKDYLTVEWRDEGPTVYTLAGSSIVDRKNKKRHMALLDTNGRCLCSEHTGFIEKGKTKQLYAQFDAPPNDVKQVDLALGNLSVVTVPILEG
ncbi:hypothetical protein AB0P17_24255 [Streptomyces sp. NPDC088124]|uniref:hypothetical protein n=1 Tax=Streptomyces sp. NPDC088124 TaxID=3154654 RepID=UPI0034422899